MNSNNDNHDTSLLAKMFENKSVHDVTLVGNDGMEVTACRSVLVCGSEVFQTMLPGPFKERSSNKFKFDFEGIVLLDIVRHLHALPLSILEEVSAAASDDEKIKKFFAIEHRLDQVNQAADFLLSPKLCDEIKTKSESLVYVMKELIKSKPQVSFWIVEQYPLDQSAPNGTVELAWATIRKNHRNIFSLDDIKSLSQSAVESILRDKKMEVDEFDLFQVLQKWREGDESRTAEARELCKAHIDLKLIDPAKFPIISKSGFFSESQVMEAYQSFVSLSSSKQRDEILPPLKRQRLGGGIKVEGAGSSGANGTYSVDRNGSTVGNRRYIKEGRHQSYEFQRSPLQWDLVQYGPFQRLYTAPNVKGREFPPTEGWKKVVGSSFSLDPPPKLTIL